VILEGDEQLEVGPAQLSRQCLDNLPIEEFLSEEDHVEKVRATEAAAELRGQLLRHCRNNQPGVIVILFSNSNSFFYVQYHDSSSLTAER